MTKFRKLPVIVDAEQYVAQCDESRAACIAFGGDRIIHKGIDNDGAEFDRLNLLVTVPGGTLSCKPNDWIVRDVNGNYAVVPPDQFDAMYEVVPESELPPA